MRNPADFRTPQQGQPQGPRDERDAELMAVANMLVAEVIEMAKVEVARRRKSGATGGQPLQLQQPPCDERNQQPVPASAQRLKVAYGSLKERLSTACGSLAERLRGLRAAYRQGKAPTSPP